MNRWPIFCRLAGWGEYCCGPLPEVGVAHPRRANFRRAFSASDFGGQAIGWLRDRKQSWATGQGIAWKIPKAR